jgi:chloramphenicol 3-O phosphotransferase
MPTTPPTIILLIGTSSAGKTTLARQLQAELAEPYLLLGIDDIFRMVPERRGGGLGGPLSADGFCYDRASESGVITIRYGAVGEMILSGMHRAVAAFAETGNHIIVDEMLLDERILVDWIRQVGRFRPYLAHVTAGEEVLEQRERQRGNEPGLARGHLAANDLRHYDLEIDTTHNSPQACAQIVERWLATRPLATAIEQYRHVFGLA